MKKIALFLSVLLLCLSAHAQMWFPFIRVESKQKQMELQELAVDIQLMDNIATTTYDMTFFNPNNKVLEGEMVFPLSPNQTVVGMSLDIHGSMRAASAVDKDQARKAFEELVRRNIDPALVEKISGNQFRMRIYPFNSKGTRRIQIVTEESLPVQKDGMKLSVPLTYQKTIERFAIRVQVLSETAKPTVQTDLPHFVFAPMNGIPTAIFEAENYLLNNTIDLTFPAPKSETVYTGAEGDKAYFYTNVAVKQAKRAKPLPKKVAVFWDVSESGTRRDLGKEKALLSQYLQKIENVKVELIPFNINRQKSQMLTVEKKNTLPVLNALNTLVYDGATRLDNLDLASVDADEILIFSDGMATIGDRLIKTAKVPVYTISSSKTGEFGMLSDVAQKSWGRWIDLNHSTPEEALTQLTQQPLRLIAYKAPENVRDIYPLPTAVIGDYFTFTGVYSGQATEMKVQFGYDEKNITETKTIKIGRVDANSLVPRQWAAHRARELEQDAKGNREALVQLGKDFSILTEYTSLLVLDRLDDYLRYQVAPKDPELLEVYNRHVYRDTEKSKYKAERERKHAIIEAVRKAREIKKWWTKDFHPEPPTAPNEPWGFEKDPETLDAQNGIIGYGAAGYVRDENGRIMGVVDSEGLYVAKDGKMMAALRASEAASLDDALESEDKKDTQKETEIKLKKWSPNMPYIKELRAVSNADLYKSYLSLRDKYRDMPAFFFDVSDEFANRGLKEQAILILTNLLEMKTDDAELLRATAHKLQNYGQPELAEILFKRIIEMRPEEPQGLRDLAVLYDTTSQNQKALDTYMAIIGKKWDNSEEIAREIFVDLNGLLARDNTLDIHDVHPGLIFNMPIDLRIVLGWSSRDRNVGLSVTDPYHKAASWYDPKDSGSMQMNTTWGWGPQSYMVKKAIEGKYQIRSNSYWNNREDVVLPVFAWMDVYTNFGRKNQKHERTLVRMDELRDNQMGSVSFKAPACPAETPVRYQETCTTCDDTRKLFVPEEQCNRCPNRKMFGEFCVTICAADKPMQSSVGNCYDCNHEKALLLSETECAKCPNREMKFGYCVLNSYSCPADKPLREGVVTCQSCDYEKSMVVSPEDCAKCPNREMVGKYCALKQCPPDKPLQLANGVCYDCNVASADVLTPEECAKCPNRKMQGKYCIRNTCTAERPILDKTGNCHACDSLASPFTSSEECAKCSNRTFFDGLCKPNCDEKNPIQDSTGSCHSCDFSWAIKTTEKQCAKCPNRELEDGLCIKKTCANDKDIESRDGSITCYPCDSEASILTYPEECAKCPDRLMIGEYCVKPCSNKGEILDVSGRCQKCDVDYPIQTDEKTCAECPDRIYKDGRCIRPCSADRPVMDRNGYCHDCDETYNIWTDEIECQKCPNRKQFGESCKITCDKYEPMQDNDDNGRCYDCDEERGLKIPKEECDKCPNREMVNDVCYEKCPDYAPLIDQNGDCWTCDLEERISRGYYGISFHEETYYDSKNRIRGIRTTPESCAKCPDRIYHDKSCINKGPENYPIIDLNDRHYYSCDEASPLRVPQTECDKCPNREMVEELCILKECPDYAPIQGYEGKCYPCYTDDMMSVSKEQCDKCPNRVMHGPLCTLKECPPDRPMVGNRGYCFGCMVDDYRVTSPTECAKCPNREMRGNYCVKKKKTKPTPSQGDDADGLVIEGPEMHPVGNLIWADRPSLDRLELAPLPGIESGDDMPLF